MSPRWILLVVLAACRRDAARPEPATPTPDEPARSPYGATQVATSEPAPFLGDAGLTQVTTSTTTPNEWGSTTYHVTQVSRGGAVVCELSTGGYGSAELHSWRTDATVVRRGADPLRFEVQTSMASDDLGFEDTCTRYELPDDGACEIVLQRTCTVTCAAQTEVTQRPGTGKLIVTVIADGAPMEGASVLADTSATTDADGVATLDAGSAAQVMVITGPSAANVAIAPRAGEDTVVTVTATGCSCCAASAT